jgi:hypothetical protein
MLALMSSTTLSFNAKREVKEMNRKEGVRVNRNKIPFPITNRLVFPHNSWSAMSDSLNTTWNCLGNILSLSSGACVSIAIPYTVSSYFFFHLKVFSDSNNHCPQHKQKKRRQSCLEDCLQIMQRVYADGWFSRVVFANRWEVSERSDLTEPLGGMWVFKIKTIINI